MWYRVLTEDEDRETDTRRMTHLKSNRIRKTPRMKGWNPHYVMNIYYHECYHFGGNIICYESDGAMDYRMVRRKYQKYTLES